MAEDENNRLSYVYYIHRWHDPPAPDDVVVPVPDMEAFMMRTLQEEIPLLQDPVDSQMRAFYHDHWDGGALRLASASSFADGSRLGVRRVLGCGHFILCVLYMTLNYMQVQEGDQWPYADFWPRMRDNLHSTGLLDRDAPCNAAGVYRWLQGHMLRHMFDHLLDSDPYRDYVRTPQTKLRVLSSPCSPAADDTTDKFRRNYQEFLVLHLHLMDEMQMLQAEPYRAQYLKLMRRSDAPVDWTPPEVTFNAHGGSLRSAMSFRRKQQQQQQPLPPLQEPAQQQQQPQQQPQQQQQQQYRAGTEVDYGTLSESSESTIASDEQQQSPPPPPPPPPAVASGAGQTRRTTAAAAAARSGRRGAGDGGHRARSSTAAGPREIRRETTTVASSSWQWHRSTSFRRAAQHWQRSRTVGGGSASVRVVEKHWRLGCLGCPGVLLLRRLPPTQLRRRRFCKWVTVKRTVLVKRPRLVLLQQPRRKR